MSRAPYGAIIVALALSALPLRAIAAEAAEPASAWAEPASATAGPFAIGVTVKDSAGETVGRITRLTTAEDGRTLVMVRLGSDSFAVPASRLHMDGEVAVASVPKAQLKSEGRRAGP